MTPPPPSPARLPSERLAPLLALLAVALVYGQMVAFHFVNWDDPTHVYRNPALLSPETAPWQDLWFARNLGYAMPVTLLSWRLDTALHGPLSPETFTPDLGIGFHVTQFLLVLGLALAAYRLFLTLLTRPWRAAVGVLLAMLHPLVVEPLVWTTGRKDLLCALFVCLALDRLLAAIRADRTVDWLGFVLLAALAMGSKPVGVVCAPLAAWLVLVWPGAYGATARRRRHAWLAVAVTGVLAAALVLVDMQWHRALGGLKEDGTVTNTLRNVVWALGYHVQLWLWPVGLRPKYLVVPPGTVTLTDVVAGVCLLAAPVLLLHPRTRTRPVGLAAALALFAYLPASGLVGLKRFIADTYMLLPTFALALALASLLPTTLTRRTLPRLAVVTLLLAWTPLTWAQVGVWHDSVTLWTYTRTLEPRSPEVCRMLGHGHGEERAWPDAVRTYQRCMAEFGEAPFANNLAVSAVQAGDKPLARQWFRWILARDPGNARAQRYLGVLGE